MRFNTRDMFLVTTMLAGVCGVAVLVSAYVEPAAKWAEQNQLSAACTALAVVVAHSWFWEIWDRRDARRAKRFQWTPEQVD